MVEEAEAPVEVFSPVLWLLDRAGVLEMEAALEVEGPAVEAFVVRLVAETERLEDCRVEESA